MEPIVQIYLVVTGDARGDSRMHDCALGKLRKLCIPLTKRRVKFAEVLLVSFRKGMLLL